MIIGISVASAALLIFAGVVVFVLFNWGIVSSYHPMKKPREGQLRIACVGDSLTYGCKVWNWRKNNYPTRLNELLGESYCVNNFAYTNRTALFCGDYPLVKEKVYMQSLAFQPKIVFLLLGSNDSKAVNWDEEKFISDYGKMIERFLSLPSSPKVYALLPPPVFEIRGKVRYGLRKPVIEQGVIPAVKRVAEEKGVDCIDLYELFKDKGALFPDGIHPNANGSRLLAEHIFERLKNDNIVGKNAL